jgi:hypothetical protein
MQRVGQAENSRELDKDQIKKRDSDVVEELVR